MRESMERQSRESMFFHLLRYYRDYASTMKIETFGELLSTGERHKIDEVDAFPRWADDIIKDAIQKDHAIRNTYVEYIEHTPELVRYHLIVGAVLRFISDFDGTEMPDEFKTYVSIFQSQITEEECWLIIIHNSLSSCQGDYADSIRKSKLLRGFGLEANWDGRPLLRGLLHDLCS